MVSPYLSRPLRSLREALESGRTTPQRRSDSADAWPVRGLPGAAEATAARPDSSASPTLPLAPRRRFTVVTGGAPEPSQGSDGA